MEMKPVALAAQPMPTVLPTLTAPPMKPAHPYGPVLPMLKGLVRLMVLTGQRRLTRLFQVRQ